MELSIEELNYMLNAIDTHVRANGIKGAAVAVSLANKIEVAAKAMGAPPVTPPGGGEAANED